MVSRPCTLPLLIYTTSYVQHSSRFGSFPKAAIITDDRRKLWRPQRLPVTSSAPAVQPGGGFRQKACRAAPSFLQLLTAHHFCLHTWSLSQPEWRICVRTILRRCIKRLVQITHLEKTMYLLLSISFLLTGCRSPSVPPACQTLQSSGGQTEARGPHVEQ